MKIAVITGASSGMGREAAKQIDEVYSNGIEEIWLIARRTERLKALSETLKHNTRILPFDLTDEKDLAEFELTLSLLKPNIKMLINASGYGVVGQFSQSELKEQTGMVRLNCEALTHITHVCLKYIKRGGRIIQFASSAAFVPQIGFSVYAASKAYVLSFSRSLNEELRPFGISVTAVCPGPVDTEFFDIAEKKGSNFNFKKYFMADASKVVEKAIYDSYKRKSVSVYSIPMQLFMVLAKITPHNLILRVMNILK